MRYDIDDQVTEAEAGYITDRLIAFADSKAEPRNSRAVAFVVRSKSSSVVGGIRANTVWDWLQIEALWVSDELRGQGLGRTLLQRAEARGKALGCHHARLNTFDFEARSFYVKNGYVVVYEAKDFPKGHSQFRLTKDL